MFFHVYNYKKLNEDKKLNQVGRFIGLGLAKV